MKLRRRIRGASLVFPIDPERRVDAYVRQRNGGALTPRQRHRIRKKMNQRLGAA